MLPLLLVWLAIASIGYAAGVPGATLRTASQVALVPTWFLAAYIVVVAVAPLLLAVWERLGWWSIGVGLALGGLVDWWSIAGDNHWVGFANYLVVWATVHQLGFAWLDGSLASTGRRVLLAVVGLAGLVTLVWAGPYPISMIGVDDAVLNNSYPTRVTLAFLGMFQAGAVLLAERRLAALLERPKLWAFAVVVNLRIMSIYLWHLTAMVLVIGMSLLAGGLGLRCRPAQRVLVGDPAGVVRRPRRRDGGVGAALRQVREAHQRPSPGSLLWRPALRGRGPVGGLGVMAASGIVSGEGVHWVWPLLPVARRPRAGGRAGAQDRLPSGQAALEDELTEGTGCRAAPAPARFTTGSPTAARGIRHREEHRHVRDRSSAAAGRGSRPSLAVNLPGPAAAARLRALGARVTKVEPASGDPLALAAPA